MFELSNQSFYPTKSSTEIDRLLPSSNSNEESSNAGLKRKINHGRTPKICCVASSKMGDEQNLRDVWSKQLERWKYFGRSPAPIERKHLPFWRRRKPSTSFGGDLYELRQHKICKCNYSRNHCSVQKVLICPNYKTPLLTLQFKPTQMKEAHLRPVSSSVKWLDAK